MVSQTFCEQHVLFWLKLLRITHMARLLHDCRVHGGRVQVVIVNVPDVNERRVGGVEHCGDGLIGVNADGVAAGAPHYVVVEYQGQLGVDILLLDW